MTFEPSDMDKEASENAACHSQERDSIQSSMRPHCRQTDACRAKGAGHCRPCTGAAVWADPAKRANALAGIQRRYAEPGAREKRAADCRATSKKTWRDPEMRARLIAASAARNSVQDPNCRAAAQTEEAKAKRIASNRRSRYSWCPEDMYPEYRRLVTSKGISPRDARRIIEDDVARNHPSKAGKREVDRIAAELRLKHEREKAQRY